VGLEIGPGDEVIVPGYTFMASALAVLAVGAIPVIAEINETLTIDPADVEKKISPSTKAVIPVHMLGLPADMDGITSIAKKHNLKVLEDACQADGMSYKGRRLGSWGDAGAFSFNDYKIISAGEGGALVTDDRMIYERALVYHDGGSSFRPYAKDLLIKPFAGLQFRASEIMGAILRVQLRRLDGIISDLQKVQKRFIEGLAGSPGLQVIKSNDPAEYPGIVAVFQFRDEITARSFAGHEGVNGWLPIDSGKHIYSNWEPILEKRVGAHPALNPFNLPQNKHLRTDYAKDMCPATLDICRRTVCINLNPDWTDDEIEQRIEACRKAGEQLS
jgi:dTDP-4-amino-4,6-dideoxygalactose transaminase